MFSIIPNTDNTFFNAHGIEREDGSLLVMVDYEGKNGKVFNLVEGYENKYDRDFDFSFLKEPYMELPEETRLYLDMFLQELNDLYRNENREEFLRYVNLPLGKTQERNMRFIENDSMGESGNHVVNVDLRFNTGDIYENIIKVVEVDSNVPTYDVEINVSYQNRLTESEWDTVLDKVEELSEKYPIFPESEDWDNESDPDWKNNTEYDEDNWDKDFVNLDYPENE